MYSVNVYDRAGEFERNECGSFELALAVVREKRRAYPEKVVKVFNLDRCDYDTDGLTEDEREAVDNVEVAS